MGAPMSGSMSGERKRSVAAWPKQPRLSSTLHFLVIRFGRRVDPTSSCWAILDPSATLVGCAILANPLALRVLDALVAEVAWYRHATENSIELTPAHRLTQCNAILGFWRQTQPEALASGFSMTSSSAQDPSEPEPLDLKGVRILVVEDSWLLGINLKSLLRALGADVLGPVATTSDAERLISGHLPDAALVDFSLRGDELAHGLIDRLHNQGVRVVVISGYADLPLAPGSLQSCISRSRRTCFSPPYVQLRRRLSESVLCDHRSLPVDRDLNAAA